MIYGFIVRVIAASILALVIGGMMSNVNTKLTEALAGVVTKAPEPCAKGREKLCEERDHGARTPYQQAPYNWKKEGGRAG